MFDSSCSRKSEIVLIAAAAIEFSSGPACNRSSAKDQDVFPSWRGCHCYEIVRIEADAIDLRSGVDAKRRVAKDQAMAEISCGLNNRSGHTSGCASDRRAMDDAEIA